MLTGGLEMLARELTSLAGAVARLPAVLARQTPCLRELPPRVSCSSWRSKTPVLLLHGYLGTEAAWASLTERLHTAGFGHVFTLGYDSLSAGVPELAACLVDAANTVATRTGQSYVHLVGHSLGGLVIRYVVQELGLDTMTCGVVTVATPYRGVGLVRLGPGPAAAQLRPTSTFLRHLPPLTETQAVRWAAIYGGADVVVPAPRGGHDVSIRGYGHHSILHSAEFAAMMVAHLVATEDLRALRQCGVTDVRAA